MLYAIHLKGEPRYDAYSTLLFHFFCVAIRCNNLLLRIWTPPVLQANRVDGFWCNCFRISGFLLGSVNYPSHDGIRA